VRFAGDAGRVAKDAVGRGRDEPMVGAVDEGAKEHLDGEWGAAERGHESALTLDVLPSRDDVLGGVRLDDIGELRHRDVERLRDLVETAGCVEHVADRLADHLIGGNKGRGGFLRRFHDRHERSPFA